MGIERNGLILIILVNICGVSWAQDGDRYGGFVAALKQGSAIVPVPVVDPLISGIKQMQAKTNDNGPIMIEAVRVERFVQQPSCGRVRFRLVQPSSHTDFKIGGELNICEDGNPPRRVCENDKNRLIEANKSCADGQPSKETEEIAQAIERATQRGDKTREQINKEMKETQSAGGKTR